MDRKRQMLVAMATGTGKTFTLVNQVFRMMEAGVAKRILFLVDRRSLAAQAVREFASFEPRPGLKFDKVYEVYSQRFQSGDFEEEGYDPTVLPRAYLTNPEPGHAFVYVCTIQRMARYLYGRSLAVERPEEDDEEDDAEQIDIPILVSWSPRKRSSLAAKGAITSQRQRCLSASGASVSLASMVPSELHDNHT